MPPKPAKKDAKGAAAPAGASEAEREGRERQEEFVRQSLQALVTSLKQRVKELEEEGEDLRRARTKVNKDTHDFVSYFQDALEKKDAMIEDLKERLRRVEFESAREIRRLKDEFAGRKDEMEATAGDREKALQATVADLRQRLLALESYRERKEEVDAQVVTLQGELERERHDRHEEVRSVERRWMEDKKKMLDEQTTHYEDLKRQARAEAQRRLDEDVRRIVMENKRMSEEIRFHREQTAVLAGEVKALTEQNRSLRRELELAGDSEREWAVRGTQQRRQNRELLDKVQALEASLGSLARDFEAKRRDHSSAADRETDDLRLEVRGLRQLVRLKNRELRTVRRLAEIVLAQRSEVEQYFLEALAQVKQEIRARRGRGTLGAGASSSAGAASSGGGAGSLRLPPVKSAMAAMAAGGGGSHVGGGASAGASAELAGKLRRGEPVLLRDLNPEDRERVLRLLFARINRARGPAGSSGGSGGGGGGGFVPSPPTSPPPAPHGEGGRPMRIGAPFGLSADVPTALLEEAMATGDLPTFEAEVGAFIASGGASAEGRRRTRGSGDDRGDDDGGREGGGGGGGEGEGEGGYDEDEEGLVTPGELTAALAARAGFDVSGVLADAVEPEMA